jgi:uncharacterized protein YggE
MIRLREVRDNADEALRRVAERAQTMDALFEELAIPSASRTTSGVSVREEREYERNRWINKGFAAEAGTMLRLADPSVLGRLITEATSRADAQIDGPWWRVLPSNPARVEACRQAAEDARTKAQAYAEALGARLGPITWIREPTEGAGFAAPASVFRAQALTGSQGQQPDVPIEPGELDVHATVDVTFELTQG